MCTVTYIPTGNGVLLASNRDERTDRAPATPPATYMAGNQRLIYPKDAQAGGTWIALKEEHSAAVLLNGAFENHIRKPGYRRSRGLIMLDIIGAREPSTFFRDVSLDGIEPFTLILLTYGILRRCTWDGDRKHVRDLDPGKAHIWSSATLYGPDDQKERQLMLEKWLSGCPEPTTETLLDFHLGKNLKYETSGNQKHSGMRTVSVTSLELPISGPASIRYQDLTREKAPQAFEQPVGERHHFNSLSWKTRRFFIRLLHWEYWPFDCLYLPMVPLWLWLSLRARSLLFFSAANPGIAYSGFIHERKSDIYPLLPPGSYPKTVLCKAGMNAGTLGTLFTEHGLDFPLIAKPDIGERGMQVKLLRTRQELETYRIASKVDFLLQEYMAYENEVGIFYYRFPGSAGGHISGIVGKEFLSVKGDGQSTLLSLLMRDDRAVLQLSALARAYGKQLERIPAADEKVNLVPYGNHSRGAKFIDLTSRITPELSRVIDQLCRQIPGFFFGRMDIRFKSWDDLEAGKNFSIIELNGTGSEPTHIYDPGHSLLFAWKEIYRHWKIVYQISMSNVHAGTQRLMTWQEGRQMRHDHKRHLNLIKRE
nr:NRDE family protein [uncultured Dyadobacter sp.]